MFQFHSGSIKRLYTADQGQGLLSFNSTVVRLKEANARHKHKNSTEFQFHSGSIKRIMIKCSKLSYNSFNSTVVRLKAKINVDIKDAKDVSIPQWFD